MGKRVYLMGLAWAAGIAALILLLAPPLAAPSNSAEWVLFASLIALLTNLGRRTPRGIVSPISTGALLTYLALGSEQSVADVLRCVASGATFGYAVWFVRMAPARVGRAGRTWAAHQLLLAATRPVLGLAAGHVFYRALDGARPWRSLAVADALPRTGLVAGYFAVAAGLVALERVVAGYPSHGTREPEWAIRLAVTLPPLPMVPLGAIVYHTLSAEVFALLVGNMLGFVLAIRLITDARLRLRQQVEELTSLSMVSRAVSTAPPLDDLLTLVARQALHLLEATRCQIALLEPEQHVLRVITVRHDGEASVSM